MRILIVAINFAPELTGIGKYVGEMTQWLAARRHDVRVITAPPYYPAWRIGRGYSSWRYRQEQVLGARVYRCPLYVPQRPSGLRRVVHLLTFALSSAPIALWQAVRWRPQLVFVVEPPLAAAPVALAAARLAGAKTWLHVQDFEVDAAFDLGLLRAPGLRRAISAGERWLMHRFDRVSTISERMVEHLGRKRVPTNRVCLFPNWVDGAEIFPIPPAMPLRRELGVPDDRQVFLYSGNLGRKQGLEILIEVARRLESDARLLFLICGEGPAREPLERLAAGLSNVAFRDLQPRQRLNELLGLASVHLLPQRGDAEDLVLPSKLCAMMASGRPVIVTAREGSGLARAAIHGGVVVPPEDADALARAVVGLADSESQRRALAVSGREFACREWDKDAVLERTFSAPSLAGL